MVGFSAFVSIGSMLDVGWGDLIDYLGDDPAHAEHRDLHGVDRRRALVPLGGAGSGADQADHRDQGRAHRGGGEGRGVAHRARSPAATRCSTPPSAAAACCGSDRSPSCSTWPRCSPSSRARRARGWRSSPTPAGPACSPPTRLIANGRRAGRALRGDDRGARTSFLPPHWSHGNPIDILGDADARPLRQGPGDRRAGPEQRRPAGDPDPPGDDATRPRPPSSCKPLRPARAASRCWRAGWAGPTSRPGETILEPGGHPDLPLPRHRRPRFHADVAIALQPPGPLRDPDPAGRHQTTAPAARRAEAIIWRGAGRGPDAADRGRIEGVAGRLRHPDRRDARSRRRGRGRRHADEIGYPGRAQAASRRRSRTRPTSAACS